jgi:hypothetical protein
MDFADAVWLAVDGWKVALGRLQLRPFAISGCAERRPSPSLRDRPARGGGHTDLRNGRRTQRSATAWSRSSALEDALRAVERWSMDTATDLTEMGSNGEGEPQQHAIMLLPTCQFGCFRGKTKSLQSPESCGLTGEEIRKIVVVDVLG